MTQTSTKWRKNEFVGSKPPVGTRCLILRGGAELMFATYRGEVVIGDGMVDSWVDHMGHEVFNNEVVYWMPEEEVYDAFPIPIEGLNA